MSLLLEALKKAELAKQGAQPDSEPAPAQEETPFPRVELTLEEPEETRPPVITRESLPDISQPLEINSEEISSPPRVEPRIQPPPPPPRPAPVAAPEPAPLPPPVVASSDPPIDPPEPGAQRDAARHMFEAKEVDYNPRKPFYLTIAGLVTAGACYGGYVWWQMQPRYAVNTAAVQNAPKGPPPPAPVQAAAAASPLAEPEPPAPAATQDAPAASAPVPQSPSAKSTRNVAAGAAVEKPAPPPQLFLPTRPTPATAAAAARPAAGGNAAARAARAESAPIAVTPSTLQVDPALNRAYGAYQAGNLDAARDEYQRVLERDASNRDALLGMAAIDLRARSYETAELRYLKLLEINPRDTHAHAGLIALQGNLDPAQSESRIKTLITGQPDATHLYFTLGNLYAAQRRWVEAQDAYFKAYSAEPENPDFAFNLAVSLDQLRQRRLAAEHYRKAVSLAAARPAAFDKARAEQRAGELER